MSEVTYRSDDTVVAGGPSPRIWADCPVISFLKDPGKGIHIMEDFEGGFITDDAKSFKFALIGDSADIEWITDEQSVVVIDGPSGANNAAYLISNILYELDKNNGKKFWLEARINFLDSSEEGGFILGLGEDSLLDDDGIADNGTSIADGDFIGFAAIAASDGAVMGDIHTVYHEDGDGGAPTDVEAAVVDMTTDATAYDDEYIKLGMRFDGKETVTFYVDGVKQAETFDLADLDTGDQLTEDLGVVLGIKHDASVTASGMQVDWLRFACEK